MRNLKANEDTAPAYNTLAGRLDAARGDAGGCVAPRAAASEAAGSPAHAGGRREAPALDLSLGHFGTQLSRNREAVLVVDFGDFVLEVDQRVKTITVQVDPDDLALMTRMERRALERRSMKAIAKLAAAFGFEIEGGHHG